MTSWLPDILAAVISFISVVATGFVGWFFGRRKTNEEVRSMAIDNDVKLSNHYKTIIEDIDDKFKSRLANVEDLYQQKEKALAEEIRILKRRIRLLESENKELRASNRELKQKNRSLEAEIKKLK